MKMIRKTSRGFASRLTSGVAALAAGLALLASPASAQQTTKGTDFWLTFLRNYDLGVTLIVYVSADVNASCSVTVPGLGFASNFPVAAGTIGSVTVPLGAMATMQDGKASIAVHVTASQEVAVYALNLRPYSTDATLVMPTPALGLEHLVMSYRTGISGPGGASEFAVVAPENGTTVTITPSVTTGIHTAGVPFVVTLDQGEVYQLQNTGTGAGADLTGTLVGSDKPVAVFSGTACVNIPPGYGACDHIVEQVPPTTAWGEHFFTVPLASRLYGDTFRFLAAENSTTVTVDGVVVATLDRGQFHERIMDSNRQVVANNPLLVAQFANGQDYDGQLADPFMMLIPPAEQFLSSYLLATPATGFARNFVNVVIPASALDDLLMDGASVTGGTFNAIGASPFVGAAIPLELGSHSFSAPLPFGVFMYGFNDYDSYGYAGGFSLSPVATVNSLQLSPDTATVAVGQQQELVALVLDQYGNPVVGVRVDFDITGANPQSGFAFTDSQGYARFAYTAANGGVDQVVASVGQLTDESDITWTGEGEFDDVTKLLRLSFTDWWLNPDTGTIIGTLRMRNTSKMMLRGPFWYAYEGDEGCSLMNPTGVLPNGIPYVDVTASIVAALRKTGNRDRVFNPGEVIQFSDLEFYCETRTPPGGTIFAVWASPVPFDGNGDGEINDAEVLSAVDAWTTGQADDVLLLQTIRLWKSSGE